MSKSLSLYDDSLTPFSVGLGRFINFAKGDFIGREYLINADKECLTWGIRVEKGTAIRGRTLKINGKIVGEVTSSTWSPYQVCGVGIVRMQNSNLGPLVAVGQQLAELAVVRVEDGPVLRADFREGRDRAPQDHRRRIIQKCRDELVAALLLRAVR